MCLVQDEYARIYWQDYTADSLGLLIHMLSNMDKKNPTREVNLYSKIAHAEDRKTETDKMSAKQILNHIKSKL